MYVDGCAGQEKVQKNKPGLSYKGLYYWDQKDNILTTIFKVVFHFFEVVFHLFEVVRGPKYKQVPWYVCRWVCWAGKSSKKQTGAE